MAIDYCKRFFTEKDLSKLVNLDNFIFKEQIIIVDPDTRFNFSYYFSDQKNILNYITFTLMPNSELDLLIQCENNLNEITNVTVFKINMFDDAKFNCTNIGIGSSALAFDIVLTGARAQANLRAITKLSDLNKSVLITRQYHSGKNSKSNIISKKILKDYSCAYYSGKITVGEIGDNTEAAQEDYSLMMSDQSKSISIPSLEVSNFNVKCKHASATGTIDQKTLWYLSTFGFDAFGAKKFLFEAFLGEKPDKIDKFFLNKIFSDI